MPALRAKDFTTGVPIELVFRNSIEPAAAPGNFGDQLKWATSAGVVYLDPEPARQVLDQLRALRIAPGEPTRIVKIQTSHNGHRFHVERPNLERQLQDSITLVEAKKIKPEAVTSGAQQAGKTNNTQPNGNAAPPAAAPVTPATPNPASAKMMACFMAAIDAVSEAQAYATRKGLGITFSSENVTSAALSCYINDCRNGGRA
jgi:hypothetical protein